MVGNDINMHSIRKALTHKSGYTLHAYRCSRKRAATLKIAAAVAAAKTKTAK